jgi:hypothetical protein
LFCLGDQRANAKRVKQGGGQAVSPGTELERSTASRNPRTDTSNTANTTHNIFNITRTPSHGGSDTASAILYAASKRPASIGI